MVNRFSHSLCTDTIGRMRPRRPSTTAGTRTEEPDHLEVEAAAATIAARQDTMTAEEGAADSHRGVGGTVGLGVMFSYTDRGVRVLAGQRWACIISPVVAGGYFIESHRSSGT